MLGLRDKIIFIVFLTLPVVSCHQCGDDIPWSPKWMVPREDLCCRRKCDTDFVLNIGIGRYDQCCRCNTFTTWRGQELDIYVEYLSAIGQTVMLPADEFNPTSVYRVRHTDGKMTEFPTNLCFIDSAITTLMPEHYFMDTIQLFWTGIVVVDFSRNRIKELISLNCLKVLDTLNLSNNKIRHVSNQSIENLSLLRVLNLSGNRIQTMDAAIISSPNLRLFYVDLSKNDLPLVDVSNVFSIYPFCTVDLRSNKITDIINELGWKLNTSDSQGPGFVKFNDNLIETFPDFKALLGLEHLMELGVFYGFGFDFRNILLDCDCSLVPLLRLSEDVIEIIWRSFFDVVCSSPSHLKGQIAWQVDLNQLVCRLDDSLACPKGCTCTDKPSIDTLQVDCQGLGLIELPSHLPNSTFSHFISLNVAQNHIQRIANVGYLEQIAYLNISDNHLVSIDNTVLERLTHGMIDISNNMHLRKLSRGFQYRSLCDKTIMSNINLDCECDDTWLEHWIDVKTKACENTEKGVLFKCSNPDYGTVDAMQFTSELLECNVNDQKQYLMVMTVIIIVIICLLGTGGFIYKFSLEIIIILLRMTKFVARSLFDTGNITFKYDVAISFNEEDRVLRKWVMEHLVGALESRGYRVFVPLRDVEFGSERDRDILFVFEQTRDFVLVLSESYLKSVESEFGRAWTENEWKYVWIQYRKDRQKQIVIINYDHISSFNIDQPQIAAYLRVGKSVEFSNHDYSIMDDIFRKLGKPTEAKFLSNGMDNKLKPFVRIDHAIEPVDDAIHLEYKFGHQMRRKHIMFKSPKVFPKE